MISPKRYSGMPHKRAQSSRTTPPTYLPLAALPQRTQSGSKPVEIMNRAAVLIDRLETLGGSTIDATAKAMMRGMILGDLPMSHENIIAALKALESMVTYPERSKSLPSVVDTYLHQLRQNPNSLLDGAMAGFQAFDPTVLGEFSAQSPEAQDFYRGLVVAQTLWHPELFRSACERERFANPALGEIAMRVVLVDLLGWLVHSIGKPRSTSDWKGLVDQGKAIRGLQDILVTRVENLERLVKRYKQLAFPNFDRSDRNLMMTFGGMGTVGGAAWITAGISHSRPFFVCFGAVALAFGLILILRVLWTQTKVNPGTNSDLQRQVFEESEIFSERANRVKADVKERADEIQSLMRSGLLPPDSNFGGTVERLCRTINSAVEFVQGQRCDREPDRSEMQIIQQHLISAATELEGLG